MKDMLVRVVASDFVAGLILREEVVVRTAPILRKISLGKTRAQLRPIFAARGWIATILPER